MVLQLESLGMKFTFAGVILCTLALQHSHKRIEVSRDRALIFVTVGIVGYVLFGFSELDITLGGTGLSRFFSGMILVFTVHRRKKLDKTGC